MIPRVVPKAQLETAMGIFNLTLQASFAVGFAFLGPLLVTLAGPSFVLGVVTVFYAAATVACIGLPAAPPVAASPATAGRRSTSRSRQLREGFAAIAATARSAGRCSTSRPPRRSSGVIGVLGPALAASLGLDPKDLIVVVLPLGLGVVAGVVRAPPARAADCRGGGAAEEAGLVAFGLAGDRDRAPASLGARRACRRPGRRRAGLPRRCRLRDDDRVGPDRAVREHAGRRPRPRVRRPRRRS